MKRSTMDAATQWRLYHNTVSCSNHVSLTASELEASLLRSLDLSADAEDAGPGIKLQELRSRVEKVLTGLYEKQRHRVPCCRAF